jgi:hypothetical protein
MEAFMAVKRTLQQMSVSNRGVIERTRIPEFTGSGRRTG